MLKALKGFVSQAALALSGRTGLVTQREKAATPNHQHPFLEHSSYAVTFQVVIRTVCLLHVNTVFEILAYSQSRSFLTW